MSTRNGNVTISGQSPLLMHQYPMVEIPGIEKKPPEEQAELATYRTPDGKLYVPAVNLQRAFVAGGTFVKGKGRASLQKIVAACVIVAPEYLLLGQEKYEIDARSVVIPSTKGRVRRYRPKFNEWGLSFEIEYDDVLLSEAQLRDVVDQTGSRIGLLDFRPECKGPFGRFKVTHWTNGAG